MHTIVKFFISLLFALVVGILPVPAHKTITITVVDAVAPAADASSETCKVVLLHDTFRDDAALGDC